MFLPRTFYEADAKYFSFDLGHVYSGRGGSSWAKHGA